MVNSQIKLGGVLAAIIIGVVLAIVFISDETQLDQTQSQDPSLAEIQPDQTTSELTGTIPIGILYPLTGDLSSHGEENAEASLLAIDDFNSFLTEQGHDWHFDSVLEDSQTSPVVALEKVTALKAKGIDVIIGPETSSNIRNVKGYADSNNMLLISCCSTAPSLAIPDDSVYRIIPDDSKQGPAIASLIQSQEIEVIVPVYRADAWGEGLYLTSTKAFSDDGGISDLGIRYNPESPEFSASVSLLAEKVNEYSAKHGQEKVGVLIIGFAESLQFMQAASNHEILNDVRWFGTDANTKEHRIISDEIGLQFANDVQFTTVQFAATENEKKTRVSDYVNEQLGRIPSSYAYSSYDAVWIAGLAILDAQSTDVDMIKSKIPQVSDSYFGAIGSTKLNEAGDLATADYSIWGIVDDSWQVLGNISADRSIVWN